MTTNGRNGSATGGDAERDPRLDRLYREAPREEPPARLDAAILAAAHREVGARPRPLSARLRAWRVPVSIAAVVMLSVSLVTLVRKEGADQLDPSTGPHSMDARTAAVPQQAPEIAKTPDRAQPAQPAPDAIGAQQQAKPASPAARNDAAAKAAEESAQRSAAASALFSEQAARRSTDSATGLSSAAPEARAPVPAPAVPAPQPFRDAPATSEPRPAPSTDAAGAAVARPSPGMRGNGETASSAAPAESKIQAEPTERMAQRDRAMAGNIAGSSSADRSLTAPAPAAKPEAVQRPAPQPLAKRAQAGPGRIAPLIKELDSQPAEKWLEKIEALRREERRGESDELLAEFKRRFPDYPLPPSLR